MAQREITITTARNGGRTTAALELAQALLIDKVTNDGAPIDEERGIYGVLYIGGFGRMLLDRPGQFSRGFNDARIGQRCHILVLDDIDVLAERHDADRVAAQEAEWRKCPGPDGVVIVTRLAAEIDDPFVAPAETETQQTLAIPSAMPARSRMGDPVESDLAAETVDRATSQQVKELIVEALDFAAVLTDELIVDYVEIRLRDYHRRTTPQRVRTIRKELADEKLIIQGPRGSTSRGRPCRSWRLNNA